MPVVTNLIKLEKQTVCPAEFVASFGAAWLSEARDGPYLSTGWINPQRFLEAFHMPMFEEGGVSIEVDEDGFIVNPDDWTEAVAAALAGGEGVEELTEEHWKVMHYLRDYYEKFGVAPMIRKLCKETGFPLKRIYDLFPSGPAKGACKLAGLPKPTGCV